jgi:hypothetical protein
MRKIWSQFILPMIDVLEKRAVEFDDGVTQVETVWARQRLEDTKAPADGDIERMDD